MKKYLLFSLPVAAMLPLALVVSCSSDNSNNLPELDENGNGTSTINPIDVLGDTSNMTIDELKNLIQPELTEQQNKEKAKLESIIESTKAKDVLVSEVTKDNYQTYFSTKFGEENSILNSALSDGYSIETAFIGGFGEQISIAVLFKDKDKGFYYDNLTITGFKNSKPEYSGTDKEKFLASWKDQENSLKKQMEESKLIPNWYFGLNQIWPNINKVLGLETSTEKMIRKIAFYFEDDQTLVASVMVENILLYSEGMLKAMSIGGEVGGKFWAEHGMFDKNGAHNKKFVAPTITEHGKKGYQVDWTNSTVTDKSIKDLFQKEVDSYNEWAKQNSLALDYTIFSQPIKFKKLSPSDVNIHVEKGTNFNLDNFKKTDTTMETKLAMFKTKEGKSISDIYEKVELSKDEKLVTFTVKAEQIKVKDKTYYGIGINQYHSNRIWDGINIPQTILNLDVANNNGNNQGTNPENNQGITK